MKKLEAMSNISEFERTKPTVTMSKLKTALRSIETRMKHAESRSEQLFLEDLKHLLTETMKHFKNGE